MEAAIGTGLVSANPVRGSPTWRTSAGPGSPTIDECANRAAQSAARAPSSLPADGAPALDLLADYHLTAEVRLFAS